MKYICTVCGQVIESDTLPEVCPVCGAKTFKVMDEENKAYADEHRIGVAKGWTNALLPACANTSPANAAKSACIWR